MTNRLTDAELDAIRERMGRQSWEANRDVPWITTNEGGTILDFYEWDTSTLGPWTIAALLAEVDRLRAVLEEKTDEVETRLQSEIPKEDKEMQISITRTKQAVFMGDHAQDLLDATYVDPNETVQQLVERTLRDREYVFLGGGKGESRPKVKEDWFLTIRAVGGRGCRQRTTEGG